MIKACVIGYPIKHSRSPLIHGYWLKALGIEGTYQKVEVSPADLAPFLKGLPRSTYIGCNITLPHKEAASTLVDQLDDRAKRTGSINTVYVRDGLTHATSTDGQGFVANIRWRTPNYEFNGKRVLVLGAGGSSRAIIDELLRCNVAQIFLANRTLVRAEKIAGSFDAGILPLSLTDLTQVLGGVDLLINTTSAGIADDSNLDIAFEKLPRTALVTDINYVPLITPFLQQAEASGLPIVPGLGMLLHQAVTGFELWFGTRPTVTDELYALVARDIDPGYVS